MQTGTMIGVIGGSGLYRIDGLQGARWITVTTPWGDPSDQVLVGQL
ncbi:MAG: S-methyl-5'-thioadenosine phosphorylase, partial [Rhodobacter sp.]|nr:S-methyl-5'-thioadenosine phosphorylase [Rhodobacter sp.]